jgi:hypothetical protein
MWTSVRARKPISNKSPTFDSVLTPSDTIQRLTDKSGDFYPNFFAYQPGSLPLGKKLHPLKNCMGGYSGHKTGDKIRRRTKRGGNSRHKEYFLFGNN